MNIWPYVSRANSLSPRRKFRYKTHLKKLRNVIQIRQIHWLLISPIAQSIQVCFTNRTPLNFTLVVFVVCICPNVPVFRWSTHIAWNSIMTVYSTLCTFLLEQVTILFVFVETCATHTLLGAVTCIPCCHLCCCVQCYTHITQYTLWLAVCIKL